MIYVIPFGCSLLVGQQVAYVKLLRVVPKALEVVVFALILLEQVDEHAAEVEQRQGAAPCLSLALSGKRIRRGRRPRRRYRERHGDRTGLIAFLPTHRIQGSNRHDCSDRAGKKSSRCAGHVR